MTRRYAIAGLGHRAQMYVDALRGDWSDTGQLVALCDPNRTRMDYYNRMLDAPVATCHPDELATVLSQVDALIVTSPDFTHADHVCAALDAGVDVIVEKPLTIDAGSCARIADAAARSSADLVVTFNYRYSPRNSSVREILGSGVIGTVTAVHFEWLLDTVHGADYFRRWHRYREKSGGLLVHKSTHHFDLVGWWLSSHPAHVFAETGLRFYGPADPPPDRPERAHGAPGLGSDPWLLDMSADPRLKALYLDAEHEDGYLRDRDVFAPDVTIDDTMSVLVRYTNGAVLTYALNAYSPREGYRVAFTGTRGRLELEVCERSWTSAETVLDPSAMAAAEGSYERLTLQEHWKPATDLPIVQGAGAHGGGDRLMLDDVFRRPSTPDPLRRRAGYRDGLRSVLTGVAADRSARTGQPVHFAADGLSLA